MSVSRIVKVLEAVHTAAAASFAKIDKTKLSMANCND